LIIVSLWFFVSCGCNAESNRRRILSKGDSAFLSQHRGLLEQEQGVEKEAASLSSPVDSTAEAIGSNDDDPQTHRELFSFWNLLFMCKYARD
jgi:hypothetical protein